MYGNKIIVLDGRNGGHDDVKESMQCERALVSCPTWLNGKWYMPRKVNSHADANDSEQDISVSSHIWISGRVLIVCSWPWGFESS